MEELLHMAVLIDKNRNSNNGTKIVNQISTLKVLMNGLEDLIETEKNASKMREDKIYLLRGQLLATSSNQWINKYSTLHKIHQDMEKSNTIAIPKIQLCALGILSSKMNL